LDQDVSVDANFPRAAAAAKYRFRGALCFPIKLGEEVLGVVECFSRRLVNRTRSFCRCARESGGSLGNSSNAKNAEEAVRRSERDLADFFENATQGLHWVDANGVIVRANRAELELLGYAPEEYIGRHIAEFHEEIEPSLQRIREG